MAPIAVVGMGCRLPGGIESPAQFWQVLAQGREVITEVPPERWDQALHHHPEPRHPLTQHVSKGGFVDGIDQFDPGFFGLSPREAVCMDPQQRLLLEVAWRALEDGAQPLERLKGRDVGVFIGISSGDYGALLWASEQRWLTPDNDPFILAGNTGCIAANRLSYLFDWRGPSFTVDTACSSSLVAVHQACASLWRGESELALVGGVQALLHPGLQSTFCKAGLLSAQGRCRSFDAAADGYVRSEGAGAVLLKPLESALRDGDPVQAVIRGTAVNSDGRSPGMAAPSQKAQAACVREAYSRAGIAPNRCTYVEAHGTGTRQGDPIEVRALGSVLGEGRPADTPCRVGSVKSNLGHSETAAGITGLIKAVLCLKQRQLPASLHCQTPNPAVDWAGLGLQVQTALEPFPALEVGSEPVVGVSSFGFGGTNAHVVLTPAPAMDPGSVDPGSMEPRPNPSGPWLLLLSARTDAALDQFRLETAAWLEAHPDLERVDVCATSLWGRSRFPHVLVCGGSDRRDVIAQLRDPRLACWQGRLEKDGDPAFDALLQAWPLPQRYRWVSLPGHPFLRQRYWWPRATAGEPVQGASLWLDHLGLAPAQRSPQLMWEALDLPGDRQHLRARIEVSEQQDLTDHRIRGAMVFPAAGHLALAFDWLQHAGAPLQLEGLVLEAPLRLQAFTAVQVQVVVNNLQLELFSKGDEGQKGWSRLGVLARASAACSAASLRPSLDQRKDLEVKDAAAFYADMCQRGLDYGRCYQVVQAVQAQPGLAEATLVRPIEAPDRCLLDGCLQVAAAALPPGAARAQLLLPVGLERITMQTWPLPDQVQCWVQIRPAETDADAALVVADLWIEANAEPVGWIEGLRLRRLSRPMLDLLFPAPAETTGWDLLETEWVPLTPPLSAAAALDASAPAAEVDRLVELEQPSPAALLERLQACDAEEPVQLRVVVRDADAEALAVRAALRCLALERPRWTCSWWQLPSLDDRQPDALALAQMERLSAERSELRWCNDVISTPRLQRCAPARVQWLSDGSGRLDGLQQRPVPVPQLMAGELELQVEATGLNFRDVLNALGLLQAHAAALGLEGAGPMPFGGEAIGRVLAVGDGVDPGLVGQRVLAALTVGSLATHVVAQADLCVPWPQALPLTVGASVSTAFLTAMHGLETLAQLQPGETVLIHAAAGGVGQAALQIAHRCGARILATASQGKQEQVRAQPGVEAVFDSRSTAFAEQVLAHTNGRGVDVVLNSLKGEWVECSFAALAEGGRFVELGKLEVWTPEQVQARRPDARYLPFDLLEVATADPLPLRRQLLALITALQTQVLNPIPCQTFPVEQLTEAFRLMAQGRHVGKLVILLPPRPLPVRLHGQATYLVTGALGGIGLQLLPWLADQGARSLLLVSRSVETPSAPAQAVLAQLEARGVTCRCMACDLAGGDPEAERLQQVLQALPADQPLRGVIHAAGVVRDRPVDALSSADLAAVDGPKQQGWQLLEQAVAALPALEFQLAFSSVAALLGSPGQLAYAAANGGLEAWCGQRDDSPQPSPMRLAIQWGPWAGPGMAAGLEDRFSRVGIRMLAPEVGLAALNTLLERGRSGVVAVMAADWARVRGQALPRQALFLEALQPEEGADARLAAVEQLRGMAAEQRQPWLLQTLSHCLAGVMETEPEAIDPAASLFNLGLDSLMAVEFAAVVQSELGLSLALTAFQNDPCLTDLAAMALEQLLPEAGAAAAVLDLAKEARLPADWCVPETPAVEAPGERVLMTGASGFLGAYLLAGQLRRWPALQVRCLVRCSQAEQGVERLEANLRRYGLWDPAWRPRLEVVPSDLAQPRFGLDHAGFQRLADGVGGILHNGAQLGYVAPYGQLAAANVGATRELLALASAHDPIRLELVSSVAVFEADACRNRAVAEHDPLPDWEGIHLGYSQTKWVSDRLVWAAGQAGLPVAVYRPPLVGGNARPDAQGRVHWQEGNLLQRLLLGCLQLGQVPDLEWELDAVPVDYVADAITALAWSTTAAGQAFHLQHPQPILLSEAVGRLAERGVSLKTVPLSDWLAAIDADADQSLRPLLPFLAQRWGPEGLTFPERNVRGVRARPRCQVTVDALEPLGVRCPEYAVLEKAWAAALLGLPLAS